MKTEKIEVNVYEPGDILEIIVNNIRLDYKKERIKNPIVRILIIKTNMNKGNISYDAVFGQGTIMKLHNDELSGCKYICSVDLTELYKLPKAI